VGPLCTPISRPADFHDPVHRTIYAAIQKLSSKGAAVDFVTVADTVKGDKQIEQIGGSALLAKMASEVPTASHIERYAKIVIGYSRRRRLAEIGNRIARLAHEDGSSPDELIEQAEREFLQLSHQSSSHEPVTLADMRTERLEHYSVLHEADDATAHMGTKTGFADLDELLIALGPGDFSVLAGRPHMGKTALALDIARNVGITQGKTVAVFSLEMMKEQNFDRIFGSLAGVAAWKIAKGMLTDEQFADLGAAFDELEAPKIYLDDDPNRTLTNIRSKARRLHMREPLDLLIIDYLQLIQVSESNARESQNQKISFISESLKQLARELECPVLALSQMNRESERRPDKRPQMADLRDSGSLEQDADHVLMLYRESYYEEDADDTVTEVFVRKNRPHGRTGRVELQFDAEKMSFATAV
jgi:replicative DNA helicase